MKTVSKSLLIFAASALSLGNFVYPANAASDSITAQDLGVSSSLILPTNPFYFLKEFSRGVQKTLTFDAVKKIALDLQVINEKLAELNNLEKITDPNPDATWKALDNYQKNLGELGTKIKNLQNLQNPRIQTLLKNFLVDSFKHIELLYNLRVSTTEKNQRKIDDVQNAIIGTDSQIFSGLEQLGTVKTYLEEIINGQKEILMKEFYLADILNRLEEKSSSIFKGVIREEKEDLFISFQAKVLNSGLSDDFKAAINQLPLGAISKINILDELRINIEDGDAKNFINILRQDIFEKADGKREIRRTQAEQMLTAAGGVISELKDKIASLKLKSKYLNSLVSMGDFNLKQAADIFDSGDYGQVFSQASMADANARIGLNYVVKLDPNYDFGNSLKILKAEYDLLASGYKENNFSGDEWAEISKLFSSSEKSLAALSDLISNKKTSRESLIPALYNSKILLFGLKNKLGQYI